MPYTPESEDETSEPLRENVELLYDTVVGHKIVKAEQTSRPTRWYSGFEITLDNGTTVFMEGGSDCCAYTELDSFLLNPELVNHVITNVTTEEGFTKWHILADLGDVLTLTVGWSEGNPFYYSYGFDISVEPA